LNWHAEENLKVALGNLMFFKLAYLPLKPNICFKNIEFPQGQLSADSSSIEIPIV